MFFANFTEKTPQKKHGNLSKIWTLKKKMAARETCL